MVAMDEKYLEALREAVAESDPCPWSKMVEKVKEKQLPVTNWLKVRRVLQYMINHGEIERVNNVRVEHYIRLK